MCFYWQHIAANSKDELTVDEIERISRNFNGLAQLTLSGGEPFLREDIVEICKIFSNNNRAHLITIPTNCLLVDSIKNNASKILKSCPNTFFRFSLSIDGIGTTHDFIRGVEGNFEKFLQSYEVLNRLRATYKNFNIDTATVFSAYNQDTITTTIDYLNKNLDIDNYYVSFVRGNTKEKCAKNVSIVKFNEVLKFLHNVKTKNEKRPFSPIYRAMCRVTEDTIVKTVAQDQMIMPCVGGRKLVVINENGDVYPCEILSMKMGNLRETNYDIKAVINSQKAKEIKDWIRFEKCKCTFECAINASIVYNLKSYSQLLKWMIINKKRQSIF